MIEDKATEKWKKRAQKLGLIVNAGADKAEPKAKADGGGGKDNAKPKEKGKK